MHTLTPNEQCSLLHSVEAVLYCELRVVRGGTVPDIRPITKLRTILCPKKGRGANPNGQTLIRFSLLFSSTTVPLS